MPNRYAAQPTEITRLGTFSPNYDIFVVGEKDIRALGFAVILYYLGERNLRRLGL